MAEQRFKTTLFRRPDRAWIVIPFDPDEAWGPREVHHVGGEIEGHFIRGNIDCDVKPAVLNLGSAWLRDNDIPEGEVEMVLSPFGHQLDTIAPDIAEAFRAEPEAGAFFESVAPFYRNNTIRWIESARRPETRQARIAESVRLLKARIKQR